LNHWRCASTRHSSAIGTPHSIEAMRARLSKTGSGGVSSTCNARR
jgi:hypothetical protein